MRCRLLAAAASARGGLLALVWVAFKVGALSYGGGFVIIPLMQADAVDRYHWMTGGQFLNAVALGQVTPGPVVQTVPSVGYAAAGVGGGLLAALVAFAPSFAFVLLGAGHFDRLRTTTARGVPRRRRPGRHRRDPRHGHPARPRPRRALANRVLAGAAVLLLLLRRGVVLTLLLAGAAGVVMGLAGGPLPGG